MKCEEDGCNFFHNKRGCPTCQLNPDSDIYKATAKVKRLQAKNKELREACENLVRGQLQHPTFEGYVKHAVWVAQQALKEKE